MTLNMNQFVRSIELDRCKVPSFNQYPFSLPAIKGLDSLSFHPSVTFIVGENGSGKSTILEAIAVAYGFNAEGGTKNFNFSSKETHSELCNYLKLIRGVKRPKDGFFLRAESFYNVASYIDDLPIVKRPLTDSYGGKSLHHQSHGEAFLAVFMNRLSGRGVYILDEPEAALSPSRQMAMISRIHELVRLESQFIIATHSPILMAYPHSIIYQIKEEGIEAVGYEDTDHYKDTKAFITNKKKMLDILLE